MAEASSLRHAGFVQAIEDALDLGLISRIVAQGSQHVTQTTDSKCRVERQSRIDRGGRGFLPAQLRQGGGEKELSHRKISVRLDGTLQPTDGASSSPRQRLARPPNIPQM